MHRCTIPLPIITVLFVFQLETSGVQAAGCMDACILPAGGTPDR